MIRLVLVELARFRSRRAIVLLLLAAVLLTVVIAGAVLYGTRPVGAEELARAEQQAESDAARPDVQRDLKRCQDHSRRYGISDGTAARCAEVVLPQPEWYVHRDTLHIRREVDGSGTAVMFLLLTVAVVAGTTFVGADWATGSVSNQLLFVSRRIRVWAAKAVAVVLALVVSAAVLLLAFRLTLLAAASLRDINVGDRAITELWQTSGRALVLVGAAGLGAYALTMLFRSTVATLALLFGYAVVGEAVTSALPFERMNQWALSNNLGAWLQDGVRLYDERICRDVTGDAPCDPSYLLTSSHAAAYLGLLLLACVVLSLWSFRRRDVA